MADWAARWDSRRAARLDGRLGHEMGGSSERRRTMDPWSYMALGSVGSFIGGGMIASGGDTASIGFLICGLASALLLIGIIGQGVRVGLQHR